jgi:hypothetical protein
VVKTAEEFVGRKPKPALEERRQYYNLIGIGRGDVYPFSWTPLEHFVVREKVILDQLEDFTLICGAFLEHFGMGGGREARRREP